MIDVVESDLVGAMGDDCIASARAYGGVGKTEARVPGIEEIAAPDKVGDFVHLRVEAEGEGIAARAAGEIVISGAALGVIAGRANIGGR